MKILVCMAPGKLEYAERIAPALRPGQAILKIRRVGICGTDLHAFEGTQPYFTYPRVLGHELAATLVESDDLPGFKTGEAVTLLPYYSCGHCIACISGRPNCCETLAVAGVHVDGGMADYLSVPVEALIHGAGLGLDELALVEPLAIGAHAIRRADVKGNEYVLVIGAGPIGLGTMEFAGIAGARVIAMDLSPFRLAFCKNLPGIAHVMDGHSEQIREQLLEITHGTMPQVVIDATGNLNAINQAFKYMSHAGRYILVGLQKGDIHFSHPEFHKREATLMSSRNATREDFEFVMQTIRDKRILPQQFITHRTSFAHAAAEFNGWLDPAAAVIKAMLEWEA